MGDIKLGVPAKGFYLFDNFSIWQEAIQWAEVSYMKTHDVHYAAYQGPDSKSWDTVTPNRLTQFSD